ncbi:MAG: hypothetical protein ACK4KV_00110 [Rhodocyclaceae bacterium]
MDDTSPHRRYLTTLVATALTILVMAAALNYWIDPYGIFGVTPVRGINALKPEAAERARVVKPYQAERLRPRTIVAGNSRPEMGIDPESTCWRDDERPVYNFGVPGAGFRMQTLYARHGVLAGDARRVFLGVDIGDFLGDTARFAREETADTRVATSDELRLAPEVSGADPVAHQAQRLKDRFDALFSLTALSGSVKTIAEQDSPHAAHRTTAGFNPAGDFAPMIRSEGQWVLFAQKVRDIRASLARPRLGVADPAGRLSDSFASLERFLVWADEHGVEVVLFINPYHFEYLGLIHEAGLWPALDEWKRNLTRIAEQHGVALWDFNSVDHYATETPPARGDRRSVLQWYWEPAHYKRELGEIMLARMLDRPCAQTDPAATQAFGARLEHGMLDGHLERLRAEVQRQLAASAGGGTGEGPSPPTAMHSPPN